MSRPKALPPFHRRDLAAAANAAVPLDDLESGVALVDSSLVADGVGGVKLSHVLRQAVYTPVATERANLDSITTSGCPWMQIGLRVIVSGVIAIDPTTDGSAIQFRISLPVASDLGDRGDLSGVGAYRNQGVSIFADSVNNEASFLVKANTVGSQTITFIFMYEIK